MGNVVFIGGGDLGFACLQHLIEAKAQLVGVFATHIHSEKNQELEVFCNKQSIPVYHDITSFLKLKDIELGFSIGNYSILREPIIRHARRGIIGLHAAPLPEYKGSACPAFAILNSETSFGVTLHKVEPGVDAGNIVHVERFPITPSMTSFDIDALCISVAADAFKHHVKSLITGDYIEKVNDNSTVAYRRRDIEKYRRIDMSMPVDEIDRRIRACDWPGVLQPAYLEIDSKQFLVTAKLRGTFLPY